VPWPLDTGAKLRNYHLARAVAARFEVTLLAFGAEISEPKLAEAYQRIAVVPRSERYSVGNMLRGAVGRTPLPLLNYTTPQMKDALQRVLAENQFDLIQIESVHLMNYLPALRAAPNHPIVICDWHNVESDLMRQYAERERNIARRTYARRTAEMMAAAEKRALQEFDAHVVVSGPDASRLRAINSQAKISVIENGVDASYYAGETSPVATRIVFVGSMDYHANIEGVANFARHVWPAINKVHSELRLTIVGRNPPPEITKLASMPGVEVTGSVDDVRPFYREAVAAIVPLNVGGGSRLKIAEAMAASVPVVSTPLGAEGLDVSDSENILLANSREEITNAITRLMSDADLRARLIAGGHQLVRSRYDWQILGDKLVVLYQNLLAKKRD